MTKTVLFVTYYFPPLGSMGSIRMARFARYLLDFGWQPRVLAVGSAAGHPYDHSLLQMVPENLKVDRVDPMFDLGTLQQKFNRLHLTGIVYRLRKFLSHIPPDGELGVTWLPAVYRRARRIVRQENIDVIFTASPTCGAHLIGLLLKKENGIPWVADFQDEWTQHPHRVFRYSFSRRLDVWQEQQVLRCADQIVTATEAYRKGLASLLCSSSPSKVLGKFTTITHGFDPADFVGKAGNPPPGSIHHDKFTIVYVGTLWGGVGFLTALEDLLARGGLRKDKIEVIIAGQVHSIWDLDGALLAEKVHSLQSVIHQVGWLTHREAIQCISCADLLLLVLDSHRGKATIPGKTYEYIASGKPVLALVPLQSEIVKLLAKVNRVVVVADGDVSATAEAIMRLYRRWERGMLTSEPIRGKLQQYHAKTLTGSLAKVLDRASCD